MLHHLITTRALWEGQWIDLWTIPHTLFGIILAIGAALLGISLAVGYGWVATFALFWEIFERLTGIGKVETPTNSLTDILVALIGFGIGWVLLHYVQNRKTRITILVIAVVIWVAVEIFGWLAYQNYSGLVSMIG